MELKNFCCYSVAQGFTHVFVVRLLKTDLQHCQMYSTCKLVQYIILDNKWLVTSLYLSYYLNFLKFVWEVESHKKELSSVVYSSNVQEEAKARNWNLVQVSSVNDRNPIIWAQDQH